VVGVSDTALGGQRVHSKPPYRRARLRPWSVWLTILLLMISFSLQSQVPHGGHSPTRQLFQSAATLEIVLRLPWQTIVTDEFFSQGGYPSILEIVGDKAQPVSIPVETARRGWSRQVICRYPPFKLRFSEDKVKGTLFEGQKSLKLVMQCDQGEAYQQNVVLEALAYRMYNLVSEFSLRVRPLSMTIIDSKTGKAQRPKFAFLIERDSDAAKRNGQQVAKMTAVRPEQLEAFEASKLVLFQYMIANTAWSLEPKADEEECCDNLKLVTQDSDSTPIYAIPNDFDLSGLVHAQYATSEEILKNGDRVKRVFKGFCVHNATLNDAREVFLDQESAIRSLVENESRLVDGNKTRTLNFLGQFFDTLKSPEQFREQITSNCQG
jgi:hypothetical protein